MTQHEDTSKKSMRRVAAVAAVAALGLILGLYWLHRSGHESTDDAYVAGVIVPVSAEIRGKVLNVYIRDNQLVERGQPLLEIDPADYRNALNQKSMATARIKSEEAQLASGVEQNQKRLIEAQANLDAAKAEEQLSARDKQRYAKLLSTDVISQSQYDTVKARWQVATAKTQAAEAALAEARAALGNTQGKLATQAFSIKEAEPASSQAGLDLNRTLVRAPISGRIAMKNVNPGKYVQPGQSLLSLVDCKTWVVGNFKETQIQKMKIGQRVTIKADAYGGVTFKGRVESFQPGTGSVFSLIPPENATGNFVKVVQRIPVKIVIESAFDERHPLWPGMSVVPTVDLRSRQAK